MPAAGANQPQIVIRKVKKVTGGGHHGGAWKVAYADFVTAMMAFFMLLWLISSPDEKMREGLADYFSPTDPMDSMASTSQAVTDGNGTGGLSASARSNTPQSNGVPSMDTATDGSARGGRANIPDASLRIVAEELRVDLERTEAQADNKNVEMEQDSNSLRISLMDTAQRPMFRSGSADINDYARDMLTRIAKAAAPTALQVSIEGHTDDAGGRSGGNWRLSGDRAQTAYNVMLAAGLHAERFSQLVAMADTEPVYPDQPGRPENRRITVVLRAQNSALPPDTSFQF